MTNYIKKLLALAVVAGAMTAVAAPTPVAVWGGDFESAPVKTTDGITYTLDPRGNTVSDEAIVINQATGNSLGALITISDPTSFGTAGVILIKYRSFTASSTQRRALMSYEVNDGNRGGVRMNAVGDGKINGCIEGGGDYNGCTTGSAIGESGYLLMSAKMANDGGTAVYYGESLASLSGGHGSQLRWSGRTLTKFSVGGAINSATNPSADGLVIEGIALFKGIHYTGGTTTDFADFEFLVPPADISANLNGPADGNVLAPSALRGGVGAILNENVGNKSYVAIRNSDTNKATKFTNDGFYSITNDPVGDGDFSMLSVVKLANAVSAPKIIMSVSDAAWWNNSRGLSLIYDNGVVKLLSWNHVGQSQVYALDPAESVIISKEVQNATSQFHSYLVTFDNTNQKAKLFIDGVSVTEEAVSVPVDPARTTFEISRIYGGHEWLKLGEDGAIFSRGNDFEFDEFAIWKRDVSEKASQMAAGYPIWPDTIDITVVNDVLYSELENQITMAGVSVNLTMAANTTLTIDKPVANTIILKSDGDLTIKGSVAHAITDEDLSCFSVGAVSGAVKFILPNTKDLTNTSLPPIGITYRFEGTSALDALPFSQIPYTGECGVIEIACPIVSTGMIDVKNNKNYVFADGFSMTALRFISGNKTANGDPRPQQTFIQRSGEISLTAEYNQTGETTADMPLLMGHWPSDVTYALEGGSIICANGSMPFGRDGNVTLTVGGGNTTALLELYAIYQNGRNNTSTLEIKPNGKVVVGAGGITLANNKQVVMSGGTLAAKESMTLASTAKPVVLSDNTVSTIDVAAGKTLTIGSTTALSGTGALRKTGDGILDIGALRPCMDVSEGKVKFTVSAAELADGSLTLSVPEGASEGSADKVLVVDESGNEIVVTKVEVDGLTVTLTLDVLPGITKATTISGLGLKSTDVGVIAVIGAETCDDAYNVTFDEALPEGVSLSVMGHVNLVGTGVATFPASRILLEEGACVKIDKPLDGAFTIGANRTLILDTMTVAQSMTIAANGTLKIRGTVSTASGVKFATTSNSHLVIEKGATLTTGANEAWDYTVYLENHGTINIGGTTQQIKSESDMGLYYLYSGSVLTGTDAGRIRQGGAAEPRVRILADETASVPYATFDAVWGNNGWEREVTFEIAEGAGLKYTKAQGSGDKFVEGANIAYLETTVATLRLRDGAVLTGPVMTSGTGAITLLGNNAFGEGVNLHLPATINSGETTQTFDGTMTVEADVLAEVPAFVSSTGVIRKMGAGTLNILKVRPVIDVVEGKVRIIATGEEILAGRLVLSIPENATPGDANKVEVFDDGGAKYELKQEPIVDEDAHTVTLILDVNAAITVSGKTSELIDPQAEGRVLIYGLDPENPIRIEIDEAFPAGVTDVLVSGSVELYVSLEGGVLPENVKFDDGATIILSQSQTLANTGANVNFVVTGGTLVVTGTAPGSVRVDEGGTYDVKGVADRSYPIILNGGTLTNTGAVIPIGKKQWWQVSLTKDSFIDTEIEFGTVAQRHGQVTFGLNGHTLTKKGSGNYIMANVTQVGGGTIQIESGTIELTKGGRVPADQTLTFDIGVDGALVVTQMELDKNSTGKVLYTGDGTVYLDGATVNLGNVEESAKDNTVHFVARTDTNKLKWTGDSSTSAVTTSDSRENPFITVTAGATLNIDAHHYSGQLGAVRETGWIVNNGKIVFQDGGGIRYFRDHLVLGENAVVEINSGTSPFVLYGGADETAGAQILLSSGSATIGAGIGEANAKISLGRTSGNEYGDKGAAIFVGSGAKLSITCPIEGPDTLVKKGAGTLNVGASREAKISVDEGMIEFIATVAELVDGELSFVAPNEGEAGELDPSEIPYRVVNGGGEQIEVTVASQEAGRITLSWQAKMGRALTDFVDITASGTETLTDFPVLVRLSEKTIPGFTYDRAGSDGSKIRFYQLRDAADYDVADQARDVSRDVELPFEIVDWNPEGESLVWVKINSSKIDAAVKGKFRMYWHAVEELEAAPSKKDVWSSYAGVWHMDEEITASNAATTKSKDATGNGLDATPERGDGNNLNEMVSYEDGVVGRARVISSTSPDNSRWGNHLTVADYDSQEVGNTFAFSCWIKFDNYNSWPVLVSRKATNATAGGWAIEFNSDRRKFRVRGATGYADATVFSGTPAAKDIPEFTHVVFAYRGDTLTAYANGAAVSVSGAVTGVTDNGRDLYIGGGYSSEGSKEYSINGKLDEVRLKKGETSAEWAAAEYRTIKDPAFLTFGLVNRPVADDPNDRAWIDYWTVEPQLNHYWGAGQLTSAIVDSASAKGALKSARTIGYSVKTIDGAIAPLPLNDLGLYTVEYAPTSVDGPQNAPYMIIDGPRRFEVEVVESRGDSEIDPNGPTFSGRVLLANSDARAGDAKTAVTDQDYDSPYWEHDEFETTVEGVSLKSGLNHTFTNSEGRVLWQIKQGYIGSLLTPGETTAISNRYNTLPWSSTASENNQIVLRNLTGATIFSPVYTNGIGTIYFDTVNAWTNSLSASRVKLLVQVTEDVTSIVTNIDTSAWRDIEITPVKITGATLNGNGATVEVLGSANSFEHFDINNSSISTFSFYRCYATVNEKKPLRFRIRREGAVTSENGNGADNADGFVLIDNVIASYAPDVPELVPAGKYDKDRTGDAVLGVETAFDGVSYPTVGDSVRAHVYVTSGDPASITSLRLRYRWRYLNALFDPARTLEGKDQWNTAFFNTSTAADHEFFTDNLTMPNRVGDIEYYYDLTATVPFYTYVDYATATGVAADSFGGYTEEPAREKPLEMHDENTRKPSGGKEWFVRLREWPSETRGYRLIAKKSHEATETTVVDFAFVGEGTWRALLKSNATAGFGAGEVVYRIERDVPTNPGARAEELAFTTTYHRGNVSPNTTPKSMSLEEGAETDWASIGNDDSTGYLMFSLDERVNSLTIARADYQNFNAWHDAHSEDAKFVASTSSGDGRSGVSSKMRAFSEDFETWTDCAKTDSLWTETFNEATIPAVGIYFNEAYARGRDRGWFAENGMWVKESAASSGLAFQMAGNGAGKVTCANFDRDPRGLERFTYKARLADEIDFNKVAWVYDYLTCNTDATFIAKVVMSDTNPAEAMKFDGEGTFALYASYMPGQGAYEFRVIRTGNTSIRYELSRVGYVNGELVRDVKVSRSFTSNNADLFRKWNNQRPTAFISLDRVDEPGYEGTLKITAGFSRSHSITENMPLADDKFEIETYWDPDPIPFGSFGVAAANCPAVFDHPCVMDGHVKWVASEGKGKGDTDGASNMTLGENFFPRQALDNELLSTITDKRWSIDQGRVQTFVDETVYPVRWGIKMSPLEQNLIFEYKAPAVKGQPDPVWTGLATNVVSSYVLADYETVLHRAVNGSYRMKHGGTVGTPRVDITVDDVTLYQWGGAEFGDFDTTSYVRGDSTRGYPTNFVFTSGWVSNHAVELSAKRTQVGKPCSIRTPLMDGVSGRGLGLGMMSVGYRNAATNLVLHFQVATNNVSSSVRTETSSLDTNIWTTVKTIDFSKMSVDERESGVASVYLGCHGVSGVARVLVEPSLVEAAAASPDPKFGSIEIVSAFCRDEPVLDSASWWGWNVRTFGYDNLTRWDTGSRSYLPDYATEEHPEAVGLSLALNNSVSSDIRAELEAPTYRVHMPFVQSPSFESGRVGAVSFRARMFTGEDEQKAEIRLYGATKSVDPQDPLSAWAELAHFVVTNAVYETYTYRVPADAPAYNAFRFGVTGVPGVTAGEGGPAPTEGAAEDPLPVRVMLDEVVVSQAVYPKLGFRYVYPVRTGLETNEESPALDSKTGLANFNEQPLVGENWTVQAEILAKQLPEEIDLTVQPEVTFHWYVGRNRWGFENWRAYGKSAPLALVDGSTTVYRGSFMAAPDAVVDEVESRSIVQYAATVRYKDKAGEWQTQALEFGEWVKPYWYDPVDYNADESKPFSAFTILDVVAPRRAWINEVNVFDGREAGNYPGRKNQYIEIAVPADQSIEGWSLDYVSFGGVTNTLCHFGSNRIPATKDTNVTNDYAFIVLKNPNADESIWPEGTFDGTWDGATTSLDDFKPFLLRLVRPSSVVEQEIVCVGTNWYGSGRYGEMYKGEVFAETLNEKANGLGHAYFVGDEDDNAPVTGSEGRSLGVLNATGASATDWSNKMRQTPGKCNEGQAIPENWVILPVGSKIVITARLEEPPHLTQTFGDAVKSREPVKITIPKGSETGTNITYFVDTWYEMASVKTNGVAIAGVAGRQGELSLTVGKGAMKRIEIVATTKPRADLATTYGLNANNRYSDAVMDWLAKGTTLRGEFANPGVITLAEYYDLAGVKQADLSLTDMYWLDIDPTAGARLDAGITAVEPVAKPVQQSRLKFAIGPSDQEASATTTDQNLRIKVKMVLSDATDSWSPYVLRGAAIGETSADERDPNWNSATFKIKGALQNQAVTGQTPQWLPLRWFVFDAGSFDENHEATIDVWDPFDTDRNSLLKGWEAFRGQYPIFYKWAIDEQNVPAAIETLNPDSTF